MRENTKNKYCNKCLISLAKYDIHVKRRKSPLIKLVFFFVSLFPLHIDFAFKMKLVMLITFKLFLINNKFAMVFIIKISKAAIILKFFKKC